MCCSTLQTDSPLSEWDLFVCILTCKRILTLQIDGNRAESPHTPSNIPGVRTRSVDRDIVLARERGAELRLSVDMGIAMHPDG